MYNLDPCHSHFLLIDDDDELRMGEEFTLRTNLEPKLTSPNGKIVLIVVEGGIRTLDTVEHFLLNNTAVLFLQVSFNE